MDHCYNTCNAWFCNTCCHDAKCKASGEVLAAIFYRITSSRLCSTARSRLCSIARSSSPLKKGHACCLELWLVVPPWRQTFPHQLDQVPWDLLMSLGRTPWASDIHKPCGVTSQFVFVTIRHEGDNELDKEFLQIFCGQPVQDDRVFSSLQ